MDRPAFYTEETTLSKFLPYPPGLLDIRCNNRNAVSGCQGLSGQIDDFVDFFFFVRLFQNIIMFIEWLFGVVCGLFKRFLGVGFRW